MGEERRQVDFELYQQLGAVQAKTDFLATEFSAHKDQTAEKFDQVLKGLSAIQHQLSEAKGGWKVMMLIGSLGVALAGAAAWILGFFHITPK